MDPVKRIHAKLLQELNDDLDPNDIESLKNQAAYMNPCLGKGTASSIKTGFQLFDKLEAMGHFRVGKYDLFKQMCTDAKLMHAVKLIEMAEEALKSGGTSPFDQVESKDIDCTPGMSKEHRTKLIKKRTALVSTIIPDGLLSYLIQEEVISIRESQNIKGQSETDARVEQLLDILMRKPDDAFETFIKALRSDGQQHVADILDDSVAKDSHLNKLVANRVQLVDTISTDGLLPWLIQDKVITIRESEQISRGQHDMASKVEQLLDILMRKPDTAYEGFINALRKDNQLHVAYLLEPLG